MNYLSKIFLLFLLLLSACSADPFPDCCIGQDEQRDAPFSTTFLTQFKTGSSDIVPPNPDQLLRIITQADIMTLMNSASTSQLNRNGLIGGVIQSPQGPAREAALQVTDAEGNIIGQATGASRNLFYNSLGRVPDLIIDRGTSSEGTFTIFNVPPGEIFFQVVRGGRGNGRIPSFAGAVSLGRINALPVLPERVGVLGLVRDRPTDAIIPAASASFFGREQMESANANAIILIPQDQGLPTNGEYLVRLSAPGYRDTTHRFTTLMADVLGRQQAFDPLTDDNMFLYSEGKIQEWAQHLRVDLQPTTGVIIGRIDPGQADVKIEPTWAAPSSPGKVFYFDASGNPADLGKTTDLSTFILFPDCAQNPGGEIFLNASAIAQDAQNNDIFSTGRAVAYCRPGEVFRQAVGITPRPEEEASFTVKINGEVRSQSGGNSAPGATLQIIGSAGATYSSDSEGKFTINSSNDPHSIYPFMANSTYTIKVEGQDFIPTYQSLSTGPEGGRRDLILLEANRMAQLCPPSGRGSLFGTARDLGLIDPSKRGRAAEGISLKVLKESGEEVGRIVSFDEQGKFIICDLPFSSNAPSLFQIRVTSPEDSGAFLVTAYPDGVTVVSIDVNKALPRETSFRGEVHDLRTNDTVGETALSVLGTQKRSVTDASGRFDLSLDSNSRFIVRAEKEGYLPSYNYQVETSARSRISPPSSLWTISATEADALAQQAGIPLPLQGGILAGTVFVPGFDAPGPTDPSLPGLPAPVKRLHFGFFDQDQYTDLLSVSERGMMTLLFGNGQGGFEAPTLSFPLRYVENQTSGGPLQNLTAVQLVEIGDFNLDGLTDMVVLEGNKLIFFPGTGNRLSGFEEGVVSFDSERTPKAMAVAELDGDGYPDLAVAVAGQNPLLRLINKKDDSFAPFQTTTNSPDPSGSCGSDPKAISVRQSGFTIIDILIADATEGLCDFTFNGEGSPLPPIKFSLPAGVAPSEIIQIKTAFLDSDSIPDFLLLHNTGGSYFLGPAQAQDQDTLAPNPVFLPSFDLQSNFNSTRMLFTDINRDNRVDLIVGGEGGMLFFTGNGGGRFGAPITISTSPVVDLVLADTDQDGKEDLAASGSTGALQLFRGSDRPQAGVRVEARNAAGEPVGVVAYLDPENQIGQIAQGAGATTGSGRFIFFNVPAGLTNVSVAEGGSGNALVTAYSGGLSYAHLNMNPIQPATVMVDGQVINPTAGELAGISVEEIEISALGTTAKTMSGADGKYQIHLGANSEHIIKLDP